MHWLTLFLIATASAYVMPRGQQGANSGSKTLKFPLQRFKKNNHKDKVQISDADVHKGEGVRKGVPFPFFGDDALPVDIGYENWAYVLELGLGSTGNKHKLMVDTGSSDFWVDGDKLNVSNWEEIPGLNLNIKYVDNSISAGKFGNGLVYFENGLELNTTYAVSHNVTLTANILDGLIGAGHSRGEANNNSYPNFLDSLFDNDVINVKGYSYRLHPEKGSFVFGGVDIAKIDSRVVTLPRLADAPKMYSLFDSLNVTRITGLDDVSEESVSVILDTGSPLSYFAREEVDDLFGGLDGYLVTTSGIVAKCNQSTTEFVTFQFDGLSIDLSHKDLVVPIDGANPWCFLAFQPKQNAKYPRILGQQFLQHVYVQVNHEKNTISVSKPRDTDREFIVAWQ